MRLALILSGVLLLSFSPCWGDDLARLLESKKIVIGVRESSPPFAFFDKAKGRVSGYDIEFAQYVARKLGLVPIFKTVEPADRIPALKSGRVDILFATFGKNLEREKEVDFSLGYFVGTQKMVAKKGTFHDLLQLDKLTVCVPKGTSNGKFLRDLSSGVQIKYFDDYTQVFAALADGSCEYASGPEATMLGNLAKMPVPSQDLFEVSEVPIASEVLGAGIRKGEVRLRNAVNEALISAEKSGQAAKIFEHWFGSGAQVKLNRFFKIMR